MDAGQHGLAQQYRIGARQGGAVEDHGAQPPLSTGDHRRLPVVPVYLRDRPHPRGELRFQIGWIDGRGQPDPAFTSASVQVRHGQPVTAQPGIAGQQPRATPVGQQIAIRAAVAPSGYPVGIGQR